MEKTIHSKTYKILRDWLIKMRHERGLTQRDLADLLDVPHSWVGKIEVGERRLDLVEYLRVCKILEINPHEGVDLAIKNID